MTLDNTSHNPVFSYSGETENAPYFTESRIRQDLDYRRAMALAQLLFSSGRISEKEFGKLSDINFAKFPPLFSEIYPEKT